MKTILPTNNFKIEDQTNPKNWQLCCYWKERSVRGQRQKKEVEIYQNNRRGGVYLKSWL